MNEADPSPINLDELRLLPDWLREEGPAPSKQYASHDFPTEERAGRGRDNRSGSFGGRDRRDARSGPGGPPDRRRDPRRSGPPTRGGGAGGGSRPFRDERGASEHPSHAAPKPAPVNVEFLPDERCLASINKQIRTTHLAYPLFGLARMFLQEPERHLVQFTLTPEAIASGTVLYQLGENGPITLDRSTLEKIAFDASKDQFYAEQTVQKEPLKGNFTNVARCRLSDTLLGPTNYHGYQPALRVLYESRFSRRMSFEDFRHNIEISTDPALIERWKEEARTTTTVVTRDEPPTELKSMAEARQHFRQHHLDGLLRTGTTLRVHGSVARKLPEPSMMQAIRESHERELRYPAQFVQLLRQGLQNAGLHIFKHRKRVVYVSLARPTLFVAHGAVSENVKAVLETIAQSPLCTRKILAERVLAKNLATGIPAASVETTPAAQVEALPQAVNVPDADHAAPNTGSEQLVAESAIQAPEAPAAVLVDDPLAKSKAALAADLRFLVQSGHIIEFHNGTFDLPLPPKAKEEPKSPRVNQAAASRIIESDGEPDMAEEDDEPTYVPVSALKPVHEEQIFVSDTVEELSVPEQKVDEQPSDHTSESAEHLVSSHIEPQREVDTPELENTSSEPPAAAVSEKNAANNADTANVEKPTNMSVP